MVCPCGSFTVGSPKGKQSSQEAGQKKTYRNGADAVLVVDAVHTTAASSNLDIACTLHTYRLQPYGVDR